MSRKKECSDRCLLRRIRQGDDDAMEKLLEKYRGLVRTEARKFFLAGGDEEDLIQEGMLALIGAVDSFDAGRNICFSTYAYYKINGRMINFLQRVEAKAPVPVEDTAFGGCGTDDTAIYDASSRSEWSIDLEKALSQLSERESDIINALVMEGRVANDVAAEKALDVSNVYRIRRKALAKLKAWLGIEGSQAASKA